MAHGLSLVWCLGKNERGVADGSWESNVPSVRRVSIKFIAKINFEDFRMGQRQFPCDIA
jgi:hypothetical protein